MKKLLVCSYSLLLLVFLSGCDGPKKSNTQSTSPKAEEIAQPVTPAADEMTKTKDERNAAAMAKRQNEMMFGVTILENLVSGLTQKLNLSDGQAASLKAICEKSLLASGKSLEMEYSFDEAKRARQEILNSSKEEIFSVLDNTQKEKFETHMNRK